MTFYKFTRISGNSKTGPIPTVMTSSDTCPDNCGLKGQGCYAGFGMVGMHWRKTDKGLHSGNLGELCANIQALPRGQLWRMNVAGDLPMYKADFINGDAVELLVKANKGKGGFTYTHHVVLGDSEAAENNRAIIANANKQGFTVNLSADTLADADALQALGIAPVVCVLPENGPKTYVTPAGNTVVTCPATYRDDIQCANCGICQVVNRKSIIGFPVHGSGKKKAEKVFKGITVKTINS